MTGADWKLNPADGTPGGRLLTPSEVARLFRVDVKTVSRWARSGLVPSFRTPGGHHRFRQADISALLAKA